MSEVAVSTVTKGGAVQEILDTYWRRNVQLKVVLLSIWGIASLVMAIIAVEPLNDIDLGGFPFGFWMAQQGAIFTFVVIIFVYARVMDGRDRRLEEELESQQGGDR